MQNRPDLKIAIGLMCLLCLVLISKIANDNKSEADIQLEQYCEMNDIRIESNGEFGWPDFKGTYEEQCND